MAQFALHVEHELHLWFDKPGVDCLHKPIEHKHHSFTKTGQFGNISTLNTSHVLLWCNMAQRIKHVIFVASAIQLPQLDTTCRDFVGSAKYDYFNRISLSGAQFGFLSILNTSQFICLFYLK